jgi:hypothetical protein
MNAPRDLGPDFRAWLDDIPPMPPQLPTRTLDQTRHTRQRRRWLWFLPGPKPTAGADGHRGHARPPASIRTIHIGGTTTMISPAKMVMAAAAATLAGSLLLAGQLPTQEPNSTVTNSQGPGKIVWTEGNLIAHEQYDLGESTATEQGVTTIGEGWRLEFRMDDPRLSVTGGGRLNEYSFGNGGPKSWTGYFENEDGAWAGTGRAYTADGAGGWHHQILLTGHDGYAGLTAILSADQPSVSGFLDVYGVVFTGELPPLPDPAPASR